MVAVHDGEFVRLVDLESGDDRHQLLTGSPTISSTLFSTDGNLLAIQGHQEFVVWDVVTGKKKYAISSLSARLDGGASLGRLFLIDEQNRLQCQLAFPDRSRGVARFAADGSSYELVFQGSLGDPTIASPDGSLVASIPDMSIKAYPIEIWSATSKSIVQRLPGHALPVRAMAFSSDNKLLASAAENGELKIWDLKIEQ